MPFAHVPLRGGLNMHYMVNGAEETSSQPFDFDKPTLAFIHAGLSSSQRSFRFQMLDPRLTGAYNLLFLDSRFHGLTSGEERETHTLENSAECCMSVLDQLQIPSYVLVGEGVVGCNTALWIAIHRPERVKSLFLASPGWMVEDEQVKDALIDLITLADTNKNGKGTGDGALTEEALEIMGEYFIGHSPRVKARRDESKLAFEERYGRGHSLHDIKHVLTSTANRKRVSDQDLAKVKVPVLILSGTDDFNVSPVAAANEWANALSSAKGGAKVATITGAPHLMMLTDYSVTNRMLAQFAQRSLQE